MGKNKLKKFSDLERFQRVFQPHFSEIFDKDFHLKGKWAKEVFGNSLPIQLELGCGKGEYTVGQALLNHSTNHIGVDIKGARMWQGAKIAEEKGLNNVAFLRTRIEFIESFFSVGEIDEIWITFPDPQLKRRRTKKRLTSSVFLNHYRKFLKDNGIIHLKTDSSDLYRYTDEIVRHNGLEILASTDNLYLSPILNEVLEIRTYYERQFLARGSAINYIAFRLPSDKEIKEYPIDE